MAKTDSKSYDPSAVEKPLFEYWEGAGHFKAQPGGSAPPFCMVIPPPNVTGALHLGHALNNTLQDILIRHKRMQGYNTFWLVGTDHAGIATQATVEKTIRKTEGKSRHDLGREELVKRIWDWKAKYGSRIVEQLKLMGCSCDYSRERFTLDEGCAKAVRETFFKLFRDGLIYRGKRLVNWDTELQTAVADDEVYHETVKGHFYHLKYPIVSNVAPAFPTVAPATSPVSGEHGPPARANEAPSGRTGETPMLPDHAQFGRDFVIVATTRPETMLGDTAVAVHPEPDVALNKAESELREKLKSASEKEKTEITAQIDAIAERRTTHLPTLLKLRDLAKAGAKIRLPLTNRIIPLILDDWAKPEFGSGCVKITPAHDANDYEVYKRHPEIGMINVLTADGKIAEIVEADGSANPASPEYAGLKFATAGREKVFKDLEAGGFVEKVEDRQIEIGHSDRSKSMIEPFLSDQWFVKMGDLTAEEASRVSAGPFRDYLDGHSNAQELPDSAGRSPSAASQSPSAARRSPQSNPLTHFSSQKVDNSPRKSSDSPQSSQDSPQTSQDSGQKTQYSSQILSNSGQNSTDSGQMSADSAQSSPAAQRRGNAAERRDTLGDPRGAANAGGGVGLAQFAIDAVVDSRVKFHPDRYAKTYIDWLSEKRDWCISRQLWWGHRILVWRLKKGQTFPPPGQHQWQKGPYIEGLKGLSVDYCFAPYMVAEAAWPHSTPQQDLEYGQRNIPVCLRDEPSDQDRQLLDECGFEQESDVLDTWFSSALWAHSTLGWPDAKLDGQEKTHTWSIYYDHEQQPQWSIELQSLMQRIGILGSSIRLTRETPGHISAIVLDEAGTAFLKYLGTFSGTGDNAPRNDPSIREKRKIIRIGWDWLKGSDETLDSLGAALEACKQSTPTAENLLATFYPTSVLSTAREIITLWVARMVMFGLYNLGKVPFKDVVIHPVIQDGQGRKMSKTLGNGVDPVDIIDKYGADALRFTLAELATETQDIRMPVTKERLADGREINVSTKFEKGRNFCNKLWQASMGFLIPNLEGHAARPLAREELRLEDRWILSRMTNCQQRVDAALAKYRFSECVSELYRFMWDDYCSSYLEMTKSRLPGEDGDTAKQVLAFVLDRLLRLLHPVTPFVTGEIWKEFRRVAPGRGIFTVFEAESTLISSQWPEADESLRDPAVEMEMERIQAVIRTGRETRTMVNEYRAQARQPTIRSLPKMIVTSDAATVGSFKAHADFIRALAQSDTLDVVESAAKPQGSFSRILGPVTVHVPVADLIDLGLVRATEEKKLGELRSALDRAEKQLSNESFVSRADAAVVEQARQRAADLRTQIETAERHVNELK